MNTQVKQVVSEFLHAFIAALVVAWPTFATGFSKAPNLHDKSALLLALLVAALFGAAKAVLWTATGKDSTARIGK